MIKQGDRITALGLEPQYPEYYKELFANNSCEFVVYGEPADYVICGRNASVWDIGQALYSDAWVMDQDVFNVLFTVYLQNTGPSFENVFPMNG